MAPSLVTEDYYLILEVDQTAAPQLIVSSYKRLALKLHPDRNAKQDATEAFQRLGRAYETLKDASTRRAYDLIYPSIKRGRLSPQNAQTPRPPPASASQPKEAAQIAALEKTKQERSARWRARKTAFDSSVFELQRRIRRLEQEIANLNSISAAEAAAEAQKNSWGAWLFSPWYKKVQESEEEKERKDRARQERRIEKDMKERRLESNKADLKKQENLLKIAKDEVDAADRNDDHKIRVIQARIWVRENRARQEREKKERERQEKERQEREKQRQEREKQERERREKERQEEERQERERMAKIWKQQQEQREKREREIAEAVRKQKEQTRKFWEKQQEERENRERKFADDLRKQKERTRNPRKQHAHANPYAGSTSQTHTLTCRHDGWWPKVQGRTACPECFDIWTYLLQCPGCEMKACPKCQAAIRPRMPRQTNRTNRRVPPGVRTPSPDFGYSYDWD